jgi:hypothetical protein
MSTLCRTVSKNDTYGSLAVGKGIMKHGMIELLVLSALFLHGPIVNIANPMEANQSPQPSPGPTDPLPKPPPSPGPSEPKLPNQILPCTQESL